MPMNSFDDYPMSWRPSLAGASGPVYRALADLLASDIAAGRLLPGTKLPPQRELADFLDVNPSTVSKAFKLCAERGLVAAPTWPPTPALPACGCASAGRA